MERLWALGVPRTASFQVLQKYQIALAALGKELLDEGAEPFQSARLLIDLRNQLVHYEPSWEPTSGHEELGLYSVHRLTKRLRGRFKENPLCHSGAPYWPYKCLGAGCALWAADSATNFMNAFFDLADPTSSSRAKQEILVKTRELGRMGEWGKYGL